MQFQDFKEKRKYCVQFAIDKLNEHNLSDWTVVLIKSKRVLGRCQQRKKIISISIFHIEHDSIEEIKDTILHEIAHALTPRHFKPHGKEWKANARLVGATPRATAKSEDLSYDKFNYILFRKESLEIIKGYINKPSRKRLYQFAIHNTYSEKSEAIQLETLAGYEQLKNATNSL